MAVKKKTTKKRPTKKKVVAKPAAAEQFTVERHWLNKSEMATALGISVQAFDKWGVKPVAQRHRFGEAFYSVRDVLNNRLEWERKKNEQPPQDIDAADLLLEQEKAKLALTREQAEGQRLKNAQMRRELAPVDMVVWALGSVASQVGSILGTLPAKLKRSQPKLGADEIRLIKTEIVKAQNACAKECEVDWDQYPG